MRQYKMTAVLCSVFLHLSECWTRVDYNELQRLVESNKT